MPKYTIRTLFLIFFPIVMAVTGFLLGYLVFSAFDPITGLTWSLLLGSGGLVGELIVNGLLIKKRNQVYAGILIAIIAFSAIGYLWFIGILGFVFGPPPAPPEEFATGYARIYLVDGYTGENVFADNIHLIYAENLTSWKEDQVTGSTFFVPEGSVWWVNISGYYPTSDTLFASGGDDPNDYHNNTVVIFQRANVTNVTAGLIKWRDVSTGILNYSGYLPDYDGVFELEIRVSINMPSRNISLYGLGSWMPNYTLPDPSFAANMSLNFVTLWLGWNATITDYTLTSAPYWDFKDVYNINVLNCTMLPAATFDTTYTIVGNFTNLNDVRIYDWTIDSYANYSVKLI